jgi:hypothetical protein
VNADEVKVAMASPNTRGVNDNWKRSFRGGAHSALRVIRSRPAPWVYLSIHRSPHHVVGATMGQFCDGDKVDDIVLR